MNKNNILLFIIILLSVLLVVYGNYIFNKVNINKETFQLDSDRTNVSQYNSSSSCNYYPWGPNQESCVKNCTSNDRIGLWDVDGRQCDENTCKDICANCDNEVSCQWISAWSEKDKQKFFGPNNNNSVLSKLLPRALNISGITYPGSMATDFFDKDSGDKYVHIKIFWENYNDAKSFMVHYYDMNASQNMIKVYTIDDNTTVEYELKGLNSNSEYSVIMYGINDYGISKASNIILIKT